jgi:hypothetical protein
LAFVGVGLGNQAAAHDVISTKLTWSQEISRIVFKRCASCHRPGAQAPMSLLTYQDARPWAKAIKEEVLERRMPPWGAIKGFGEFRHDPSLTPDEIHTVADWVEGGAPEGDPHYLPEPPPAAAMPAVPLATPTIASDGFRFAQSRALQAIRPVGLAKGQTMQVTAELPDGSRLPLLWLHAYDPRWTRTYVYRDPPRLPAGTRMRVSGPGKIRLRHQ